MISDALPATPGRGLDLVAERLYKHPKQKFLRGALMPFLGFSPWFQKLVTDNRINTSTTIKILRLKRSFQYRFPSFEKVNQIEIVYSLYP
ncbi:MAG: hypothetical protein WBZ36_29685 [Candidatus Nitrosopolaris sp.]